MIKPDRIGITSATLFRDSSESERVRAEQSHLILSSMKNEWEKLSQE